MERGSSVRDLVPLDMIGMTVVVINRDHSIELINKKGLEVLECAGEEVCGKDWFENFLPARIRDDVKAVFNKMMADGAGLIESFENPVLTRSGKELPMLWHNKYLKDENGKVTGVVSTGEDITEKKRDKIINQRIGDVILLYTAEGIITHVSPSVTHILGYSPEDLEGENIISFTHPEDAPKVLSRHYDLLHRPSRMVWSIQRVRTKQGEWIWVEGEARNLVNDPRLGAILCNFRDITERKAAKEALEKSEEKYRTLVNAMAEAVVQIDLRGDIHFVNQAYCELTGYSEQELLGQNCLTLLLNEAELPRIQHELAASNGLTDHYEIQLRRKSGHRIWVSANAAPLLDTNGNLIGMLSTLTDITQRKNAAQQLEAMNKEMTDFFYKSSHDLKGPLSSVSGLLELAKDDIKDPVAIRYCDMMGHAINKLTVTVQQVMQTIKVRDTTTEFGFIDFETVIRDVVEGLGHMPGINELHIETKITADKSFYSDINAAYSIMQNLVENAVKYRDSVGRQSTLRISIEDYDEGIRIIAEDNGIGMNSHVQKKIFDMFFRAHAGSEGTGLGLYIVKKAIEKLGGTIAVASEENIGSCFTIYLPGMQVAETPVKPASAEPASAESEAASTAPA